MTPQRSQQDHPRRATSPPASKPTATGGDGSRASIASLHDWLGEAGLADPQVDLKVQQLQERLQQDKLIVAFVAEFSRGKSELINAIFFADFGQRLLPPRPPGARRCARPSCSTTPTQPPSIRLLPIETRARERHGRRIQELSRRVGERPARPRVAGAHGQRARAGVAGQAVPVAEARRYGLADDEDVARAAGAGDERTVEIPCWRHAVINFPHPLLQQGLVILDTPGLNAIGTEPELTLVAAAQRARGAVRPRRRRRRHADRPRGLERSISPATTPRRRPAASSC